MPLRRGKRGECKSQTGTEHSLDHLAVAAAAALTAQRLLGPQAEHVLQRQWRVRLAAPAALLRHEHARAAGSTVRMPLAQISLSSKHVNAFSLCRSTNTVITRATAPASSYAHTHRHKYSHRLRWGSNRRSAGRRDSRRACPQSAAPQSHRPRPVAAPVDQLQFHSSQGALCVCVMRQCTRNSQLSMRIACCVALESLLSDSYSPAYCVPL